MGGRVVGGVCLARHYPDFRVGSRALRNTDHIILEDRALPLLLPWPLPGDPGGFIEVAKADDWRALVGGLGIDPRIPDIVRAKFHRAQTLYLVGWFDLGLIKAAELAALIALELAVMDRYGGKAIGQLTGDTRPTLAERRNKLAHGDPFDGPPTGGLLELVRDLINFAYRDYIAEAASLEVQP